jgi:hypothetical protein
VDSGIVSDLFYNSDATWSVPGDVLLRHVSVNSGEVLLERLRICSDWWVKLIFQKLGWGIER